MNPWYWYLVWSVSRRNWTWKEARWTNHPISDSSHTNSMSSLANQRARWNAFWCWFIGFTEFFHFMSLWYVLFMIYILMTPLMRDSNHRDGSRLFQTTSDSSSLLKKQEPSHRLHLGCNWINQWYAVTKWVNWMWKEWKDNGINHWSLIRTCSWLW